MNLYFLRHAIAVERGTPGYADDSKRPLTPDGRLKMKQNAKGMKAFGLTFDLVLSSPYVRALETARIVTQTFKIKDTAIIVTPNLVPEADFKGLIEEIKKYPKKNSNILLVGHEPHLSSLISLLLTGAEQTAIDFKKGGLCQLTVTGLRAAKCATLNWLLTPAQCALFNKTQ